MNGYACTMVSKTYAKKHTSHTCRCGGQRQWDSKEKEKERQKEKEGEIAKREKARERERKQEKAREGEIISLCVLPMKTALPSAR